MGQAKRKTETDPVAEVAQQALQHTNGDVKAATAFLEDAVRKDFRLREALTEPLIAQACYDAIRKQSGAERRGVWKPPGEKIVKGPTQNSARVVKLAAGNLLMFPLPGGQKLGEATRADITKAADFYEKQSADMAGKARWLRLVAQSLTGKKSVSQVLSDERLRELQTEALKG